MPEHVFTTKFSLQTKIGSGCFGDVYRAKCNGQLVAVKIQHQHHFDLRDPHWYVAKFQDECKILQQLKHRNIVQLLEFIISHSSPPMLITELLDCDLGTYIGSLLPNKIPFPETVSIMSDVTEGVVYLQQQKPPIIHRDLASKNVLLTRDKQAKIADLGLAKCFSPEQTKHATPRRGTPVCRAPEVYPADPAAKGVEYGVKVDVFSFGVMLMAVINGSLPKPEPDCPFGNGLYCYCLT